MEVFYFWNSSQNTSFFNPGCFGVLYPVHTPTAPGQPFGLPPPPALMSVSLLVLFGRLSAPCCCWNMKLIITAEPSHQISLSETRLTQRAVDWLNMTGIRLARILIPHIRYLEVFKIKRFSTYRNCQCRYGACAFIIISLRGFQNALIFKLL